MNRRYRVLAQDGRSCAGQLESMFDVLACLGDSRFAEFDATEDSRIERAMNGSLRLALAILAARTSNQDSRVEIPRLKSPAPEACETCALGARAQKRG
jgi:hypothetical protein